MTTGCTCPTCPAGITPVKGTPCRDCEIEAMAPGPLKVVTQQLHELFNGSSRQSQDQPQMKP